MAKIYVIINPVSGKDEPVLAYLHKAFEGTTLEWEEKILHKENDIGKAVSDVLHDASMVAVYGGDGTICEAAKVLRGTGVPLAVLPGGTANVMAKELNMPADTRQALQLLASGDYAIETVDMGLANGCLFLLRVNMGIMADMVTDTSNDMKERWGQLAYGITAFKHMPQDGKMYNLVIDGEQFAQPAVALTVTNAGSTGIKGYSFLPGISVADGWLDVIALDKADLLSVLEITGSMLFHNEPGSLKHWKARQVKITVQEPIQFLCDDEQKLASSIEISVLPAALKVLVPKITST